MQSSKTQELVVCKNFKLVKKLGTGAFGEIYLAENKTNPTEKYAAKLEETAAKFPQLYFEAKMYKYLSSFGPAIGVPKVYAMTTEGQYNVMLMDLLGSSLEDYFVEFGNKLSLKTVLMIGEQMVDRIEFLHEKNILHRDIKPDNFLMGIGKQASTLYIVDFGLSKKYIQDNKHIPYKEGKELTGTARYASINTHMGIEQSRRDDIESIGYVLVYLLRGILPWQNMKAKDTKAKYKMIMEKKIATPSEFLCKGFPNELAQFINSAKGLKFEQKPDYKYLKGLLATARKNNKIEYDLQFDWTTQMHTNLLTLDQKRQAPKKQEVRREEVRREEHRREDNRKEQQMREQQRKLQSKTSKEQAINQALNTFHISGSLLKNQIGHSKELNKSHQSKNGQYPQAMPQKTNNLLSAVGLETITSKITGPKIAINKR